MKKKLSVRNDIRNWHAIKRWKQHVKRKDKERRHLGANIHPLIWGNKVVAPTNLSIYSPKETSFQETVSFVDYISKKFDPAKDILDFSATEKTTAAALVFLYSVLERATSDFDGEISFIKPASARVNAHLRRSNIFKLMRNSQISYALEKAEMIPIISSVDAAYTDEVAKYIKFRYFKDSWSEEEKAHREWVLGAAIHETVDNVCTHAYPKRDKDDKRWWLSCDVIDDFIYLAIYDLGVGIPNTVHEQEWFEGVLKESRPAVYDEIIRIKNESTFFRRIRNHLSDAELIYISMLDDYTGTGQQKHGQGSKSIKKLVNDTDNGILWVYSGRGLYKFINDEVEPELSILPRSIPGTLIQWNIKLP